MAYATHLVSARHTSCIEVNKPEKNDAELSGPRMSEILEDLHSFPRSVYATETTTTTVVVLLIQSMLLKVQCATLS